MWSLGPQLKLCHKGSWQITGFLFRNSIGTVIIWIYVYINKTGFVKDLNLDDHDMDI